MSGALKFTLDHNCLIAIEQNDNPEAECLRTLLARHDAGEVCVRLVATSASERRRGDPYQNFSQFQDRLAAIGLGHLELLAPIAVVGLFYLDWWEPMCPVAEPALL